MKKLTLKLSALLLCLFCLFGAVACGQDSPGTDGASNSNSTPPPPTPTVGEKVKTEYLTYDVQPWNSKGGAYVRLIPICDIENLVIVIKVYDAENLLLQQNVREIGNVIGQQEYIYSVIVTDSFYDDKLLDSVVIEAKSGTVTGI